MRSLRGYYGLKRGGLGLSGSFIQTYKQKASFVTTNNSLELLH